MGKLNTLRREVRHLQDLQAAYKQEIHDLKATIKQLEHDKEDRGARLTTANKRIAELEEQLAEYAAAYGDLPSKDEEA